MTPTNLYMAVYSFAWSAFVLSFNLKGNGISQFSFIIPFFISSYLNRLMWIDKNFGKVFINDTFDASYNELHLSHLNLFEPYSFYTLLYCWIQLFNDTFGYGKNKLRSISSTYDSVTEVK